MSKATLLVLDDELDLVEILGARLEGEGYKVLTAGHGEEGLKILAENKVDLIITDVQMPRMTGIQMLEKIRAAQNTVPIIFITGYTHISTEEAYAKGVQAIFSKPFDFKKLADCVNRFLMPEEIRYRPRSFRDQISAQAHVSFSTPEISQKFHITNIGTGGFFLQLPAKIIPLVGQKISFRLNLENSDKGEVCGIGIVRWTRLEPQSELPTGCGVEFDEIEDGARSELINLINSARTGQFIPRN